MAISKLQNAIELTFPATLAADALDTSAAEAQVLTLFDECAPGLRRYIASFNIGPTTTDDVVQDTFLALFRHLCLGRPATNLKGWLFQVAHNLALKQRQRIARRSLIELAWDITLDDRMLDPELNPEERLASERRQRHLAEALEAMPARDQRCIALRAEGLCYRDIARALGISLGTVANAIVRAMTRLMEADKE
jgi:RNA polymerase sigma-70 factor (ECF subfamily)